MWMDCTALHFSQGCYRSRKYYDYRASIDFNISYLEDFLNFIFKQNWKPTGVFVIDECLVLFKGRFGGRQDINFKLIEFGFPLMFLRTLPDIVMVFGSTEVKNDLQTQCKAGRHCSWFARTVVQHSKAKPDAPEANSEISDKTMFDISDAGQEEDDAVEEDESVEADQRENGGTSEERRRKAEWWSWTWGESWRGRNWYLYFV